VWVELEKLCAMPKRKEKVSATKGNLNLPGKKKPCCRFCAHENLNKYTQNESATVVQYMLHMEVEQIQS
jgi:hypothetical protein